MVALVLLSLCAILFQPAFELPAIDSRGIISAGAIPRFVILIIVILSLTMFVQDMATWVRVRCSDSDKDAATPRQALVIGAPTLIILTAYIFSWRQLNFLFTTIIFFIILSSLLAGRRTLTRRGLTVLCVTATLFCTGVWALFVHVLKVPLR